ncbi:complex I NDUFA9 subunit family protein [Ottowia testudinis]|uniref:Complex I NDUFA9 subunit family protein n=1 Tax=Ottowia testudinis TaxID=2816950 RepID=A0A975CIJ7_9BURK|nr:complex I NDUFA9 subunit family protein [Ottowia testudinis]QTD44834.1 complex I NDUFA9 subunit family protein [Ottowia testudinis]
MTQRVLVLGGSGFVGRHVVERLQRQGAEVTVPTRRLAAARHLWSQPRVHVTVADVMEPATLARLVAGHDAVVNLVGILHGSKPQFERAHVELPRLIAGASAQAGGRRLVHISALGAAADGPSHYQRSKARGEAVLGQAAQVGTLGLTVLRPGVMFGPGDRFLNLFAGLQKVFPVLPLAGAGARFQPVWVRDVAEAVVTCLQDRSTIGQTYDACGPEVWTLRELVSAAGQWAGVARGRGRPVIGLPRALGRLQALALELLPGTPLMSRDNLDSMKVDNVCSGRGSGLDALGIRAAPLSAVGPLYLGQAGPQAKLDRYRRGAGR